MKYSARMITQIFLLGFLISSSCHKDTTRQNIMAIEYFPNKPENYWEYSVYDSSTLRDHPNYPREFTVKVTITGIKKLVDNVDAMVWRYEYPWGTELNYYRNSADSIKVYDTIYSRTLTDLLFPRLIFIKPFSDNQEWSGKLLWIDSFFVKKDVVQGFQNVFQIHRDYIGQQTYYHDNYWFSPNIGFVKIHFDEINQGIRRNEYWELKYYNLK